MYTVARLTFESKDCNCALAIPCGLYARRVENRGERGGEREREERDRERGGERERERERESKSGRSEEAEIETNDQRSGEWVHEQGAR